MKCPYCEAPVSKSVRLDFVCRYCHKKVFVRVDPDTNTIDYLTREEAETFDKMVDNSFKRSERAR